MQALGVDIQTIQSIVGHADTEMTEHYLHVQESIRQSAIQLFSEAFSGGQNQMRPAYKQKNPTISNVKSLDLWSSRAGQIRTFFLLPRQRSKRPQAGQFGCHPCS